jgi:hypothetical protein
VTDVLAGPGPADAPSRPAVLRRRLVGVLAVVVVLVVGVVAVAALASGGSSASGAATVVPADALGFVDVSLDPGRPAVGQALTVAGRFPDFGRLTRSVGDRIGAILSGGHGVSLTGDVLPWAGHEAALALLNTTSSTAGSLIVVSVGHAAQAHAFIRREGAVPRGRYRRTTLYAYPSGSELAFVSHYLIVGQDASVRAAVDVSAGGARSLAGSAVYQRAMATEPADRVVGAYASLAGVRRLLSPRGGVIGALGDLVYQPALQGVAIGVAPQAGRVRILIHSALDPTLQRINAAHESFTPTLQRMLPTGTILMLDVHGLNRLAPALMSAGATAGIGGGIGPLLSRLGVALGAEGVNVHQLTSLFSGETAVGIVPNGGSRTLVVVARVAHVASARTELAQLEIPFAQLFSTPNATKVPVFNDLSAGGVSIRQVALANGLELDYAVFRGTVVISTSSAGVAAVAAVAQHARSLAADPGYRSVVSGDPSGVGSLVYMSLPQVVALGSSTDLISGAGFRRLAPDLAAAGDAGLTSWRSTGASSVQITLRLPGGRP